MKFINTLFLTPLFLLLLNPHPSLAAKFDISVINAEETKAISAILQKQASQWVPAAELKKYPELYWQSDLQKQSFKVTSSQKGLEDSYFVPIQADYVNGLKSEKQWSQQLSLLIIDRKTNQISPLPNHPVLEWNFDHMISIAFRDIQGSGKRAIIVNAAGVTGIGPTGMDPFDVVAIYLPKDDDTWTLDETLQKLIHEHINVKCQKASCRSIGAITKVAETYLKNKK